MPLSLNKNKKEGGGLVLTTLLNGLQHIGIPTEKFNSSVEFYKTLGFELVQTEQNGESRVACLKLGHFVLEIWEESPSYQKGAIHHFAIDTDKIEEAFNFIKTIHVDLIDNEIRELPFWEKGIRYFNFYGPNREIIEICQKMK